MRRRRDVVSRGWSIRFAIVRRNAPSAASLVELTVEILPQELDDLLTR